MSRRSKQISPPCVGTIQDGVSTSRTSTTSLDLSSQRSSGTPTMPLSMAQLPQPFILLGHHLQPQSRSTPHTSSPAVSKPMKPETHSSRMAGQRSIISQPMPTSWKQSSWTRKQHQHSARTRHCTSSTATAAAPGRPIRTCTTTSMTSSSVTETGSSRARLRKAIWTTAMVQGAPRRAAEAATRIAPGGTNRLQLQRTTSPSSKSRPTLQPTQTSVTKSSHQASPARHPTAMQELQKH